MTCEACGATWRRSARFCGRCGALLRPVAPAAEATRRGANPALRRWVAATGAAGCLVVLGVVALLVGQPWELPAASPSQDVEVPPSPEGTIPDEGRQDGEAWEPPAPAVLCQPAPCERWRVHLPSGTSVVDGDTAYHVGSTNWRTEVTAIDVASGVVRWRETMVVPDAVNGERVGHWPPSPFTERDDLIIVGIEDQLEARSRADGAIRWRFDRTGLLPYALAEGPSDTVIVLAGDRDGGTSTEPSWSNEVILSIDTATGEPRWEREVTWPLSLGPFPEGVVLVSVERADDPQATPHGGTLEALDALTGETLWHRDAPRDGFGTAGSTLRVYDDGRAELWDIRTGAPLDLPLPEELQAHADVEVVGDLLTVRTYPEDDVGSVGQDPLQHLAVFDRADGLERFAASAPGWVGTQLLPDGGIVVASGEGQLLELTVLGPDGLPRWTQKLGLPAGPYWPRWPELLDDGTVTVIGAPPGVSDLAVHRFDPASGETLESFHLDVALSEVDAHDLEMRWPVVVDHRANGTGMRLHGPAGSLELTQRVEVLSTVPLVVRTPSGTLARLDEEILIGRS